MTKATLSEKGQLTLPAEFRRRLGIRPHDRVLIGMEGDAIVIRKALDFMALEGFLGKRRPSAAEEQGMMEEAASRSRGRHA